MAGEHSKLFARRGVPKLDVGAVAGGGDERTIVGHGDSRSVARAVEPQRFAAGVRVPHPHGAVAGGGGQSRAAGEKSGRGGEEVVPFLEILTASERRRRSTARPCDRGWQ